MISVVDTRCLYLDKGVVDFSCSKINVFFSILNMGCGRKTPFNDKYYYIYVGFTTRMSFNDGFRNHGNNEENQRKDIDLNNTIGVRRRAHVHPCRFTE